MLTEKEIEKSILAFVQNENYRPVKPKVIARKLDLLDDERAVKKALKRLIKKGLGCLGLQASGAQGGRQIQGQ